MQITLKEVLTTYWAQTVLLLAALSFLIKRLLDIRTTKIETKHSLFQQQRNAAIVRFLDSYVALQLSYRQILTSTFDFDNIIRSDFLKLIEDRYEHLYSSYFYFRIFLDPLEQARYADLTTVMKNILDKIVYVSGNISDDNKIQFIGELKTFVSEKLKENNDNFKVIGEIFRDNAVKHFPVRLK